MSNRTFENAAAKNYTGTGMLIGAVTGAGISTITGIFLGYGIIQFLIPAIGLLLGMIIGSAMSSDINRKTENI